MNSDRGGKRLRIMPEDVVDKFEHLKYRPEVILGDPEELVALSWEKEINLDLP